MEFYLNKELGNFIDDDGKITTITEKHLESIESIALDIGKRLLGGTLIVNNNVFIISMVELYYGSIGDDCHDWYKVEFNDTHRGISAQRVEEQAKEGLRFYSRFITHPKQNRIDIVIGKEGVVASYLIRNLIRMDGKNVRDRSGAPALSVRAMFPGEVPAEMKIDYVEDISNIKSKSPYIFCDTHDLFMKDNSGINIEKKHRYSDNGFNGLAGKYQDKEWNLSIYQRQYTIPSVIKDVVNDLGNRT